MDCDNDSILLKVDQVGDAACHKGYKSCFFSKVEGNELKIIESKIFDPKEVYKDKHVKNAQKYLVFTDVLAVDFASIVALENLRLILVDGVANDRAKYCLPESYKTELTWTLNARSLQNFISLRSGKSALWEIQNLANMVYNTLPKEHKYLFNSAISQNK